MPPMKSMKWMQNAEIKTTINSNGTKMHGNYEECTRDHIYMEQAVKLFQSINNRKYRYKTWNARRLRNMSAISRHHHWSQAIWSLATTRACGMDYKTTHTGHCHLNEYLHRFDNIQTPECECGAKKETIDHLLNYELRDERHWEGVWEYEEWDQVYYWTKIIKENVEYIEKPGGSSSIRDNLGKLLREETIAQKETL
jgi:hypothetical protein